MLAHLRLPVISLLLLTFAATLTGCSQPQPAQPGPVEAVPADAPVDEPPSTDER
ncbi:hypothetical protein ETAA8_03620 [Anatilimnocola aggregata]|uniref:Uncharacterized protein n=1 Tax=Anatilimnocola aggregata TaxID=2528021 RepID=A0A517Y4X1_9BACT|nr:hypothetical protein [Anatilimnocola aggregata]QDU25298.1 hypothetical protein ETAA8_03620 [Anatilimnocola aggregata]